MDCQIRDASPVPSFMQPREPNPDRRLGRWLVLFFVCLLGLAWFANNPIIECGPDTVDDTAGLCQ